MTRTTTTYNTFGSVLLDWAWSRSSKNYRYFGNGYRKLPYNLREYTSDYYPFGSTLPTRSWSDASRVYRYGFNGKEKDSETSSDNFDFGARIYDGRLGRWLSLDPLSKKYPEESNYVYVSNCPLFYIDILGEEKYYSTNGTYLGQIGTNSDIRVVDKDHVKHYTIAQWKAIIKAANDYTGVPGENWSSDLIFYGSTSYEDYFTNRTDVTNGAPVVYYLTNCFTAAEQQLNNEGYDQCGPGSNALHAKVDKEGQKKAHKTVYNVDPIGASIYIMTQLKLGIPVIVGVQEPFNGNTTSVGNENVLTGHFVVINSCTVDDNGNVSFGFIDNASTGNGDKIDNQLKLDKSTGTMVDETSLSTGADSYTVTEVRKNKKLP